MLMSTPNLCSIAGKSWRAIILIRSLARDFAVGERGQDSIEKATIVSIADVDDLLREKLAEFPVGATHQLQIRNHLVVPGEDIILHQPRILPHDVSAEAGLSAPPHPTSIPNLCPVAACASRCLGREASLSAPFLCGWIQPETAPRSRAPSRRGRLAAWEVADRPSRARSRRSMIWAGCTSSWASWVNPSCLLEELAELDDWCSWLCCIWLLSHYR